MLELNQEPDLSFMRNCSKLSNAIIAEGFTGELHKSTLSEFMRLRRQRVDQELFDRLTADRKPQERKRLEEREQWKQT